MNLIIAIFLFFSMSLNAQEQKIILGNKEENWKSISYMKNLQYKENGWSHSRDISIASNFYEIVEADKTEVLLSFEEDTSDISKKYTPEKKIKTQDKEKIIGKGALLFQGYNEPISYKANSAQQLFYGDQFLEDFTIEFWYYPLTFENGEIIFEWKGALLDVNKKIHSQYITVRFNNRHFEWNFDNIFFNTDITQSEFISIAGKKQLLPRKWSHHMLKYDSKKGVFYYIINGIPENIMQLGSQNKDIQFVGVLGQSMNRGFYLGKGANGVIDEFRVSKKFVSDPKITPYSNTESYLITKLIDLKEKDSILYNIKSKVTLDNYTNLQYYYKISNEFIYNLNNKDYLDDREIPGVWKNFKPGENLSVKGRYIQIKVRFLSSPSFFETPTLSSLTLEYTPNFPPKPPKILSITQKGGDVILDWLPIVESDLKGYKIYYGEKINDFKGKDATQGESPITIGSVSSFTIKGLKQGKVYYFVLRSYDDLETEHLGDTSEISHIFIEQDNRL